MSLHATIVIALGLAVIALCTYFGWYAWMRGKALLRATDAASALMDAHGEASRVRSKVLAEHAESISSKVIRLGGIGVSVAAAVKVLSTLSGEIGRTRSEARWAFVRMVLGGAAPSATTDSAQKD